MFVIILREIPSGRGEGPSYMKVPYTYPPFHVTSIIIALFWGRGCLESEGGHKNAFVCICTSVCMCVLSKSSKTLDGTPEEERMYGKFSFLVFRDFVLGAKFVHKMKSVCCV